jgi:HEPN domain-containing protein
MSRPDKDVLDKVRQWLEYADEDLRLARHGLKLSTGCPYRLIAYHAQQCAEKYIKAYLVYFGIDFPYSHNIARLLELFPPDDPLAGDLVDAEELTPFAVTARYPGEGEAVSGEDCGWAIGLATMVRDKIRESLRQKGLTLSDNSQ